MIEQRNGSRVRVQIPARYTSSHLILEGHVTDLSPEGLFFNSDLLDDTGEAVRVFIQLPRRTMPLEVRGEVRWVRDTSIGCGMGLKLVGLSPTDRSALTALIESGVAGERTVGNA